LSKFAFRGASFTDLLDSTEICRIAVMEYYLGIIIDRFLFKDNCDANDKKKREKNEFLKIE